MKKALLSLCCVVALLLTTSCGTSVFTNIKTIGLDATIPIYGIPVGIRIGVIELDAAALRGNSTYTSKSILDAEYKTATGSGDRIIIFTTNPQFNEGYIADVLNSPDVTAEVKLAIINYLNTVKAPELPNTISK